ncbi:hypothetical protein [Streptococcus sp. E17BB]
MKFIKSLVAIISLGIALFASPIVNANTIPNTDFEIVSSTKLFNKSENALYEFPNQASRNFFIE